MPAIAEALRHLSRFTGSNLTSTLRQLEQSICGLEMERCSAFLDDARVHEEVLEAAVEVKRVASQINVAIHALGILMCLPHILEAGEVIQSASLGAGNTGKPFDLETSIRVAEFKFVSWRGGPEAIRQNGVFKDLFFLVEHTTSKKKFLYLVGTDHPLKFLNGGRALSSVLSRHDKLKQEFLARHGADFQTVGQWYEAHKSLVNIVDVSPWVAPLAEILKVASEQ